MPEKARDVKGNHDRSHETHFDGSTKEHDGAARALAVKQRRAGSRFRYRRRPQSAHHLRLAQDAHLRAFFLAAFWISLVAAGVSTIGTIALGTDTGSDWTSVQTAVENRFTPMTSSCTLHTQPHSLLAHVSTTATPDLYRVYVQFCPPHSGPISVHASLRPQRTCICSHIFTPSSPATRLSLPTAHHLRQTPRITCHRPRTRPNRTDSSRPPAREIDIRL